MPILNVHVAYPLAPLFVSGKTFKLFDQKSPDYFICTVIIIIILQLFVSFSFMIMKSPKYTKVDRKIY